MSDKKITLDDLKEIGGLKYKVETPEPCSPGGCRQKGTWPEGMPETIDMVGTRIYEKTARELAKQLGTTPRQVSKLRSGRLTEAKPLDWYEQNNMPSGLLKGE